MSQHFFVGKAVLFTPSFGTLAAPDSEYDESVGAWRQLSTGRPFVKSLAARILQGTKKNDLETGEDQKGQ